MQGQLSDAQRTLIEANRLAREKRDAGAPPASYTSYAGEFFWGGGAIGYAGQRRSSCGVVGVWGRRASLAGMRAVPGAAAGFWGGGLQ